ncbi:uncharacterized protein LOC135074552 [Ostrinia nubilalis]|uniref:uncharacterized protein LOC114361082 n=1 Tax=Ostrinia furnacalis TaxID=93504 RepID=UPI001038FBA1|nr:uncharacterized protein LOC114361082 [Ostrinia furnacalis]
MSKYWIFVIMKSYLVLIILGFTQLVIGLDLSNITYDDNDPVCPISLFRKKRAHTEYTRWRANQETTAEFIVKVLDDDMTTPNTKQIVAVNIQPVTKGSEKIIVGGVIVPPATTPSTLSDLARDYTRFVPPTTVPITRLDEELFLAPATLPRTLDQLPPIKPKGRNSQRDESPPASPQFLARTPTLYARQYAPIAPVAFTRRVTISPLKPPTSSRKLQESIDMSTYPTRTSVLTDIIWPTRTEHTPNEYKALHNFFKDISSDVLVTRSTFHPVRTSTTYAPVDEDNEITIRTETSYDNNKQTDVESRRKVEKALEKNDKDPDSAYNMMFYNDEDIESTSKKDEQDQADNYDERNKSQEEPDSTTEKELTLTNTVFTSESEAVTGTENNNFDETNVTYRSSFIPDNTQPAAESSTAQVLSKEKVRGKRRPICNLLKLRQLNFNSPRTLPEIVAQLKQWAETSPLAKWEDITSGNLTTMENPIYMMIVDDPSSGQIVSAKKTVMIIAGIQGRDHHAVAAAMYVLYQLIERSEAHSDLLTKYRFWIIPVFNPDGYDYSMTFPHRREWSKNLRQNWDICKTRDSCTTCELYGLRCTVQPCYGVNLDRNFEYQWIPAEELRAEHPCGSLHAGARQLSEAETWALTHYLHEQRTPLFTFVAFKEGEVLGVMYPYSHTRKLRAFDHVYRQRASRAASAAYSISGRPYVAGQTSEFLPLYAGGIEDWVDGHLGIDNTYTIMMFRPTDSYNSKLITERVVHEAYAAMDTLLLQSVEPLGPPAVTLKRTNTATRIRSTYCNIYLIIITRLAVFFINKPHS